MVSQAILTTISFFVPNMRCIFWIGSALVGMTGAVMVHALNSETQRNASLAGVYLMGFYNVPWVFLLSLSSSNTAGATKKSFMGVSVAVIYGQYNPPARENSLLQTLAIRLQINDQVLTHRQLQPLVILSALSSTDRTRHPSTLSALVQLCVHLPLRLLRVSPTTFSASLRISVVMRSMASRMTMPKLGSRQSGKT